MCYVIENFQSNFVSLKWSLRLKSTFFLRNTVRFNNLLLNLIGNDLISSLDTVYTQTQLPYIRNFFMKMFFIVPQKLSRRFKTPLVLNLFKSLQFWALTDALKRFPQPSANLNLTPVTQHTHLNMTYRYYLAKKVTLLRLNKQPYKTVLLGMLKLLLTWWPQYNIHSKLPHTSMLTVNSHAILRYYNSYFFKVYNF
jgi:hypothetical protein